MAAPLLELDAVRKGYPGLDVLRGLDLRLDRGQVLAVLGASGTGKTTLLNVIGLLDRPDAGSVRIDGRDAATMDASSRAALRARAIGFVFQRFHLLPEFDVLENVLMPARCAGVNLAGARERAVGLLDAVGLRKQARGDVRTLSGGEAQRVAICRALVLEPPLILADEPTGNLDPSTADVILRLLLDLVHRADAGVLLVTHDPRIAASADRRCELRDGVLHAEDAEGEDGSAP